MVSSRQSRLLSLSIYCTATLLLNISSVDAFSLVQNAAASSRDGDGSPAAAASGGRSTASAASSATAANPLRGSLNSRSSRHRQPKRHRRDPSSSSDDFALRMGMQDEGESSSSSSSQHDDDSTKAEAEATVSCSSNCQPSDTSEAAAAEAKIDDDEQIYERRAFLSGMLATTAAAIASTSPAVVEPANAYEQAFPLELQSTPYNEVENSSNSLSKLKEERLSNKKAKLAATKSELRNDPLGLGLLGSSSNSNNGNFGMTIAGASTWALALWFATGSRSNPVVKPLANVLYDESNEDWLTDRNDGYFAELPLTFMAILSAVFVFLGVVLDRSVYFLADGDAEVSLQLAGVSVIGGAVWEVGRLAAKEKAPTREEYDRDALLYREFDEFAKKRIVVGRGSCHRSDVIGAFRRYNPKYRAADNEQYPLVDIEIERILRVWNREFGSGTEMSAAGFFGGISVDDVADVFR